MDQEAVIFMLASSRIWVAMTMPLPLTLSLRCFHYAWQRMAGEGEYVSVTGSLVNVKQLVDVSR